MKTKMLTLFLTLFILLGLTGCGSGKDLPMEVTLDGYTVVLGETTIQDIVDLGYEPHLERLPDVASDGDKYISSSDLLQSGQRRRRPVLGLGLCTVERQFRH